jgi:hypothetical protein
MVRKLILIGWSEFLPGQFLHLQNGHLRSELYLYEYLLSMSLGAGVIVLVKGFESAL